LTLIQHKVQSLLHTQAAVVKCSTQFGHYKGPLIKLLSMVIENRNFGRLATVRGEYPCNDIRGEGSVKDIPAARGQTGTVEHYTYQQESTWYFGSLKR